MWAFAGGTSGAGAGMGRCSSAVTVVVCAGTVLWGVDLREREEGRDLFKIKRAERVNAVFTGLSSAILGHKTKVVAY